MKLRIAIILFLLPFMVNAQAKKAKQRTVPKVQKQSIEQFYAFHQLVPDSACSPYLYYQVYEWVRTRYIYAGHLKKVIHCSGFVNRL